MGVFGVIFIFSLYMRTYMPVNMTKSTVRSLFLKVEMSIQKISAILSNAIDVGSSLSESEKILSKYLELDIQAKVNKVRVIIIMVMIL